MQMGREKAVGGGERNRLLVVGREIGCWWWGRRLLVLVGERKLSGRTRGEQGREEQMN